MIAVPSGWKACHDGLALAAAPPEGAALASLRYEERLCPLLPPPDLLRALLDRLPTFVVRAELPFERIVTDEGEYAAAVTVEGEYESTRARLEVGWVITDDCYAQLQLLIREPSRFDEMAVLARRLLATDRQMLGVRRRRFLYDGPVGWRAVARIGTRTDWFASEGFQAPIITVWPAFPGPGQRLDFLARQLVSDRENGAAYDSLSSVAISSDHGLSGTHWRLFGATTELTRELIVFSDARYFYPLRLEGADDAARLAFAGVARSIRPIPSSRSEGLSGDANDLFGHWSA